MNILGIYGAIGWDGNIAYDIKHLCDFWVHGSGATLIINGELKTSISEERFSRIKYDGNYPELSIQNILDYNKLTKHDIDLVVYVAGAPIMSYGLKEVGYTEEKIKEYFPNCNVEFLYHHLAHSAATFYTSGFDEANILTFDGAGCHEGGKVSHIQNEKWLIPHFKFSQGKDLTLTVIKSQYTGELPMYDSFGNFYDYFTRLVYKNKMEKLGIFEYDPALRQSYPGKIMGLTAFGDYQKIDLPDIYELKTQEEGEDCFPELCNSLEMLPFYESSYREKLFEMNPDDLAAWAQYQFEKHLLLFLSHIPKEIKRDNLCLGGGCALNVLANTKILEQDIYKNVHINTAPADDGLHLGAALYKAAEYENKINLPDDIGYLGISYTDEDIEAVL
jgi:carbamoyltransferase